jgi:hypothetical protein
MKKIILKSILIAILSLTSIIQGISLSYAEDYPIVFTTQIPIPTDFATIGSTFANHKPSLKSTGRGGDLWIRYTDGSLKNLTKAAGFGNEGFQGEGSIAVRDPAVNWAGDKVIFSMAVDAGTRQYEVKIYYWQLYEISNLGKDETPVISKVTNQPSNYNNISPLYGQNDRIIFSSDLPLKKLAHLYPQLDEYESEDTVSGLWNLNPETGDLFMMTHSPSGDFTPIIDSFGRVIFTRWDHLKRDQQADHHVLGTRNTRPLNWSSENIDATSSTDNDLETFPEPRPIRTDLLAGTNLRGHNFNHFFPWMVNEDGSELETLNHIGRHELHQYFDKSMNDDDNLEEFIGRAGMTNENPILNFLHIQEDPLRAGVYIGIDAPEFNTHSSGKIIELKMPSGMNPDEAKIIYRTHPDTNIVTDTPSPGHSGHYRDPLPLSNGTIIAAHTSWTGNAGNIGSRAAPQTNYDFRLKFLTTENGYLTPSALLTEGITKSLSYWDPDFLVSYSGNLWELHPVELRPRNRPNQSIDNSLKTPETTAFDEANVDPEEFKIWLKENNLALIVSRNLTTRDTVDKQQPLNLKIEESDTKSIASTGKVYDISHLQIFQGDMIRSYSGTDVSGPGKRVIAQPLHDDLGANPPLNSGAPAGSVKLGADGSMAALVPARRALSWQLTNSTGEAVVRERIWSSFAPGEIRVCTSCHGINSSDQTGATKPDNKPQALVDLLQHWLSGTNTSTVTPHILPHNQWHQISLPLDPGTNNSVAAIFGDDGLGVYDSTWMIYSYDTANNAYVKKALSDTLSLGVGYWIIQHTGSDKSLNMPSGSIVAATSDIAGCATDNCVEVSLDTLTSANAWDMIGYPFATSGVLSNSRVVTTTSDVATLNRTHNLKYF